MPLALRSEGRAGHAARLGLVAVAYFGAAKGGLAFASLNGSATAVWAPTGIALAAVLVWGFRMWPAIALGALAVNLTTDAPAASALGIAAGNTLEAVVGAHLLRRVGFRSSLERIGDVAALVVLATFGSTLISATLGVASLWATGAVHPGELVSVWRIWWFGDASGDLVVAPLLLVLASGRLTLSDGRTAAEAAAYGVALTAQALYFLSGHHLPYPLWPTIFLIAIRLRQAGAVVTSFVLAGIAIWFTATGDSPFATGSADGNLVRAQLFTSVASITALLVAAMRSERRSTEQELQEAEAWAEALARSETRARMIVDSAHDAFVSIDAAGAITEWNRQAEETFGWRREEAIGLPLAETIVPDSHRAAHLRGLERFLATRESRVIGKRLELPARHRDGHELPVELSITVIESGGRPIFNAFLHDISERKRRERYLATEHAVTRLLAESATLAEARPAVLEALGEGLGWALAGWWERDAVEGVLRCRAVWSSPSLDGARFEQLSRDTAFPPGVGLPGRVWESGEMSWIAHLDEDRNFPRLLAAGPAGLTSALGLPLASDGELVGVLEFFSTEPRSSDAELGEMMASLSGRVGQYLARASAEEALRRRDRQLVEAQAVARLGSWEWDIEADRVSWSDELCRIFGLEPGEHPRTFEGYIECIHPDDRELARSVVERAYEEHKPYSFDHRALRPDGTVRVVQGRGEVITDATGSPVRMFGTAQDITERKDAERALESKHRQLEEAQRIGRVGSWEWDLQRAEARWSEQQFLLHGLDPEGPAPTPQEFEQLVDPRDRPWVRTLAYQLFKAPEEFEVEFRVAGPERRIIRVRGAPVRDADGRPLRLAGTSQDVTERRRAESGLRLQSAITSHMGEGAALIDATDATIIYANPALESMFGYDRGELQGRPVWILNAPDDRPPEETGALIAAEVAAHGEWRGEVHSVRKDGSRFWRQAHIAAFDHPDYGEVWVSVLGDITERKRIEELKNEFFALVQHELRTPLTSIKGYVELMVQEQEANGAAGQDTRFLHVIERNASRLERLVGDLLFAAQLEAGELALEHDDADLGAIAADCVEAALPLAEEAEVRLRLDAEPVPVCSGDGDRLGQAIDNLLSNAIKYTPSGGTVIVRVRRDGERLLLEVEDTGIGITAADRERLFDRFFRASTATERAIPGVGLGLSITKAIVEGHDGQIHCTSREGAGTTFRVELPLTEAAARPATTAP